MKHHGHVASSTANLTTGSPVLLFGLGLANAATGIVSDKEDVEGLADWIGD